VALLLAWRPPIELSTGLNPGGEGEIYFLGRTQKSGQGRDWVRSLLLHGPAVGGCDMEGYPLRHAWIAVVSLYTTLQEFVLCSSQCPRGLGNDGPNRFADTARCKKATTECEPLEGWGLRRGGYQCRCTPGHRLPNRSASFHHPFRLIGSWLELAKICKPTSQNMQNMQHKTQHLLILRHF
jgi:hypothetical protein